jgi:hypothetical protein
MKKIMTMVVAAMLATVSVNAQQEVGSFTIQPHLGGSAGMMTNADIAPKAEAGAKADKTPNGGSVAGVELEYQLSKKFSVAAGVNYMQAGTAWKDVTYEGVKFKDMKVETSYVAVPVVANFYVAKGFALKVGLQPGFLVNDNANGECKSFNFSIPVGLSYEFKNGITLDLRGGYSLTRVDKFDGNDLKYYTDGGSLTIGYKFELK